MNSPQKWDTKKVTTILSLLSVDGKNIDIREKQLEGDLSLSQQRLLTIVANRQTSTAITAPELLRGSDATDH